MTGFEPLIGAATAGLGGLISGLVKEKGTETLKRFDFDIGKNIAFKHALVKYVRHYIDRHGTLKVVCVRMDNPVKLDEIYTAVQLLDRRALGYYNSTESLEELFRQSGRRSFNLFQAEKKVGIQVANEQQYLMVLGGPGVGKSTFLRKVGLEALRTLGRDKFAQRDPANLLGPQDVFYQHPCIPVMLELRQFNQPEVSIQAKIAEELETCGFPHAEELTELFLRNGKLLVLLDGLDEVPGATLNHVITEIENLVDRYSDNRFIASCRVAAYNFGGFKRFKDVAMAAFEDDQIERFIKNWFRKPQDVDADTATRCWELLSSKDYKAAKELAQTPLLLTLLCVVYDEYQDFPKKRHALYGEALDVLLRKWASEKRIQRDPIYQELSTDLELDLLSEIAYTSFVDNQLFFTKDVVVEQIREFLVQNLNAPNHLDAEQVLKEIEIQQGILVERARYAYSFSHLTFQEYLTAKCIVDNKKSINLCVTMLPMNIGRKYFCCHLDWHQENKEQVNFYRRWINNQGNT
jgi:predicted NACHT family NTPase